MAYKLHYSDYPGSAGPPDPAAWVGPPGPVGPQGPPGPQGQPGSIGGGTLTGPMFFTATGSTASRSLQDRAAEVVNVKDFGAVGNGTTDDTVAIKAAVAAGGTVYFPPGTYRVSGTSTILPSGTRVYGAGSARSIIRPNGMTSWTAAGGGTEFGYVFCNTNTNTYGTHTATPTTPSVQTDVGISIEGLGFDFSQQAGWIANFVFARRIYINDVRAGNGALPTVTGFTGFRFIGCDEVLASNVVMTNVVQAFDCWKGCTRFKIQNASVEVATSGGNGGAFNFNGIGTQKTPEASSDLQVENATIWLHNDTAFFLDSFGAGSSTTDVLLSNIRILAIDGTGNFAMIGRGMGGRVKVHNMTVTAATGARFQGVVIVGASGPALNYTATSLINTTSGSPLVTVTLPNTTGTDTLDLCPGNYLYIDNGSFGILTGNGLSLKGYYLVTAVSGPISSTQSGNVVTANVGANATATGPIAGTAHVQGQYGSFSNCEFVGVTIDGVGCPAADLFGLNGVGHQISDVIVTQNYNGFSTPQYRSVINIDGTQQYDQPARSIYVSNLVAAPGTGALQAGWVGDNVIQWQPFGVVPIVSNVQTAGGSQIVGAGVAGAATDTGGHLLIPFLAGTPTAAPNQAAKGIAIRYDTTAHKLWAYDNASSSWKSVVFT